MSISDNYTVTKSAGNGVTTVFSRTWPILADAFLVVFLEVDATGVQTEQTQGVDYNITTSDDSGFSITFTTAPPTGESVVPTRNVTQDQTVPYTTSKGFQGPVIEGSYDKLTAIDQEQQDDLDRSLKFQVGSSSTATLPEPDAGKALLWNVAEGGLENSTDDFNDIATDAAASAAAAAVSETNAAASEVDAAASAAAAAASAGNVPQSKRDATVPPTVTNDSSEGYSVGSDWNDVTNDAEYTCLDASVGAAIWAKTNQGGQIIASRLVHVDEPNTYIEASTIGVNQSWTIVSESTRYLDIGNGGVNVNPFASPSVDFRVFTDDASQAINMDASANNMALFGNKVPTADGTTGQVLTQGVSSQMQWADAPSGGSLVLLETQIASADSTIEFTSGIDGTYSKYIIDIIDLVPATDGTQLHTRTSTDGGSTFDSGTSDYRYAGNRSRSDLGSGDNFNDDSDSKILLTGQDTISNNASGESFNCQLVLWNPSGVFSTKFRWVGSWNSNSGTTGALVNANGSGIRDSAADVDGLQFFMSSGNITSGIFKLYGVV